MESFIDGDSDTEEPIDKGKLLTDSRILGEGDEVDRASGFCGEDEPASFIQSGHHEREIEHMMMKAAVLSVLLDPGAKRRWRSCARIARNIV